MKNTKILINLDSECISINILVSIIPTALLFLEKIEKNLKERLNNNLFLSAILQPSPNSIRTPARELWISIEICQIAEVRPELLKHYETGNESLPVRGEAYLFTSIALTQPIRTFIGSEMSEKELEKTAKKVVSTLSPRLSWNSVVIPT